MIEVRAAAGPFAGKHDPAPPSRIVHYAEKVISYASLSRLSH